MKNSTKDTASKPIAYKFGGAFFCEMPFYVNKHVLIPRFDTETLVEQVLKTPPCRVLDMCTGSGCIAVVLAKHGFDVTACDVSRAALRVAKKNAKLHGADIRFIRSDMFEDIDGNFDVIVCNPPYIRTSEIGKHDKSILFEPRLAQDGGTDGLDYYRTFAGTAGQSLCPGGRVFLEIDKDAAKEVKSILRLGGFCDIQIIKDKANNERVVRAIKK